MLPSNFCFFVVVIEFFYKYNHNKQQTYNRHSTYNRHPTPFNKISTDIEHTFNSQTSSSENATSTTLTIPLPSSTFSSP